MNNLNGLKCCFAIAFTLLTTSELVEAQDVTFEEVSHSSIQVPGFGPNFTAEFFKSDGDEDLFVGSGFNPNTNTSELGLIRRHVDGSFTTLLDHNTVINDPNFANNTTFDFIDAFDLRGDDIFFSGRVNGDNYLFRLDSTGTPHLLEPSNASSFSFRDLQALPNGDVIIRGSSSSGGGYFLNSGGNRTAIATTSTAVPDGSGTFSSNSFQPSRGVIGDDGSIVFFGDNGSGLSGIYSDRSGTLEKIVDNTDFFPGTTDMLVGFGGPRIEDGVVYFATITNNATNNRLGFYSVDEDGLLDTLVTNETSFEGEQFVGFDTFRFAVNDQIALFGATTTGNSTTAMFFKNGSQFGDLVAIGDVIGGREVSFIGAPTAAEEDNEFYMPLRFTDDSRGFYRLSFAVTAIPEPGSMLAVTLGIGFMTLRRRR